MGKWQEIKGFISSEIIKNSAKLLTASVIVQIVGLLVYPILTRLYSPEDFGLINLFLSIAGVLSLFATAEFQYAILLPKSEEKAISCVHVGGLITLVVVSLLVCTIPFSDTISDWFNAPNLAEWYWAIPVFVLLSGMWTLLNYWYTRNKRFGEIGTYQVTQCLTNAAAKCGFGFAGFLNGGLILSAILSPFIALGMSIATTWKSSIKPLFSYKPSSLSTTFREYSNFPKYSLPRAIISYINSNLPVFLLTPFFGLSEIGFWGLALTVAFRPINIISISIYQVLFQKFSTLIQERQTILSLFSLTIRVILCMLTPCFIVIYFITPYVIDVIFGANWTTTGVYIQIMLAWILINFINSTTSFISDIFQKQKIAMILEIILLLLQLIVLIIGILVNSIFIALSLYCLVSFLMNVVIVIWYYTLVKNYESELVA